MGLVSELRRRNVFRVTLAYVIIAWLILQVGDTLAPALRLGEWVNTVLAFFLILGFPIAVFFAWAFELTPEGLKKEKEVNRSQSITHITGRKLDYVIIAVLVVALVYFAFDKFVLDTSREADLVRTTTEAVTKQFATEAKVSAQSDKSIAVLSFVDMSENQDQGWFGNGLAAEIINTLVRAPDLMVSSRTSSFAYKGTQTPIPQIAIELGVTHVLEGTVRRAGDRIRVTAQLVRASDGFHLWSQNYDRKPEDVIELQEDVAIEIATALQTAMNPEALARMMSSATRSVEAYNAYLKGLAYDVSTLSTGDVREALAARDAFERATELDPEYALAYWELAKFWEVQLRTTNIVGGTVELPREEMQANFDGAIEKAIRYEQDPGNKTRFRVLQAAKNLQLSRALRLNTEYLQQRPNDRSAQNVQLDILARLSIDDRLLDTISEYEKRDGYDVAVTNRSIAYSTISDDNAFIRAYATNALERVGDSPFVQYQAHRALLWAGDIDGARQLLPTLRSSDVPEENRLIAELRQACAENRFADAVRIFEQIKSDLADDTSIMWISHKVMNQHEDAYGILADLDERMELESLSNFLSYTYFDARVYPNLMAMLETQGVEPREPRDIPYQCAL